MPIDGNPAARMIREPRRSIEIAKLGLSQQQLDLTNQCSAIDALTHWCGPLRYCLEPESFEPDGIELIPLWESELSITGFYWNGGAPVFITYPAEDPNSYVVVGTTFTDVVDHILDRHFEPEDAEKVRAALAPSSRRMSRRDT